MFLKPVTSEMSWFHRWIGNRVSEGDVGIGNRRMWLMLRPRTRLLKNPRRMPGRFRGCQGFVAEVKSAGMPARMTRETGVVRTATRKNSSRSRCREAFGKTEIRKTTWFVPTPT